MITINIDLGSAIEVDTLIMYDHNITSAATITLIGADPVLFSEAVTWADSKIIHYLSAATTKRYWQLQITDAANPDLYIEIGELYLGDYMELSRTYREKFKKPISLLFDSNKTPYGIGKKRFYNKQRSFEYDFNALTEADIALLEGLLDGITDRTTGELKPFYFNDDAAVVANTWLVDIEGIPETHMVRTYYETTLEMAEVLKSA